MRTAATKFLLLLPTAVAVAACMAEGCGRTPLLSPTSRTTDARAPVVTPTGGATSQRSTDGGCPDGFTACGRGAAMLCHDLTRSPDHCGRCGNACPPGIACEASRCRQHACQGALSFKALPAVITAAEGSNSYDSFCEYLPVLGDFDHDGILDFVGLPGPYAPMSLLLGNGDGTFRSRALASGFASQWIAAAGDVDADGWLDLASIASGETAVTVRLGSGDAATPLGSPTTYPTGFAPYGPSASYALLLADLDDDGHLDLVATATDTVVGGSARLGLWRGAAGGALTSWGQIPVHTTGPFLAAADWNRDGVLDLVFGASTLRTLLGHGDGTFAGEIACGLTLAPNQSTNVIVDVDHDQVLDLMVGGTGIFLGMNGCNFTTFAPVFDRSDVSDEPVAVADLDGDGNLDIVTAGDSQTVVYPGDGRGGFGSRLVFASFIGQPGGTLLVGDLDEDGKLDLIITRRDGWRVLLNTCP